MQAHVLIILESAGGLHAQVADSGRIRWLSVRRRGYLPGHAQFGSAAAEVVSTRESSTPYLVAPDIVLAGCGVVLRSNRVRDGPSRMASPHGRYRQERSADRRGAAVAARLICAASGNVAGLALDARSYALIAVRLERIGTQVDHRNDATTSSRRRYSRLPVSKTPPLELSERDDGGTVVLCATGIVDMGAAPILTDQIRAILRRRLETLVVDLTGVTFLATAGMSVLMETHRKSKELSIGVPPSPRCPAR